MLPQEEIVPIKGKRSKRHRHPSPLAITMSTSSGGGSSGGSAMSDGGGSTSGEMTVSEEEDMATCLILLAKGRTQETAPPPTPAAEVSFQCKTCNKSFPSFQALGGHRASHKKLPNPLSRGGESTILSLRIPTGVPITPDEKKAIRIHECSVCRAEFTSGQALGGHMRRHRPLPLPPAAIGSHGASGNQPKRLKTVLSLDLNLPAPEDSRQCETENEFAFALTDEQASLLCHVIG